MKNVELIGTKREINGTTGAKEVRRNKQVPCVLYGGEDVVHFSVEERALSKIVHSPEAHSIQLDIDGVKRMAKKAAETPAEAAAAAAAPAAADKKAEPAAAKK